MDQKHLLMWVFFFNLTKIIFKMQKPILPKGTRDFNSDELYKRNYIINTIKENFSKFGFNPIETPSFERSETLMGKYGQDGERLIFKILKSGDFLKGIDVKELNSSSLAPKIIDKALIKFIKNNYDSMLSVVPMKAFLWEKKGSFIKAKNSSTISPNFFLSERNSSEQP